MNFEQKIGEGTKKIPDQETQQAKPAAENRQNVPETTILGTAKDEEFPGSIVVKTKNAEGNIVGYAMRTKEDGTIEGNEINYQPDGSTGTVQRLNEADLARLQQQGILGEFQSIKKIEQTKKNDNANIWLQRLFLQGKNPYMAYQTESNEQMYIDEATKALQALSDSEQISLAETFSKEHDRSEKFHYVMIKMNGTVFGKKLAELQKGA
jgi:hypothetical protein